MAYDLTVWIVHEGHKCRSVGFSREEAINRAWATDLHTLASPKEWWESMSGQGMTVAEHDVAAVPIAYRPVPVLKNS